MIANRSVFGELSNSSPMMPALAFGDGLFQERKFEKVQSQVAIRNTKMLLNMIRFMTVWKPL